MGHDVLDGARFDDPPGLQEADGVADLADHAHLVGDDDDGDAQAVAHVADEIEDGAGGVRVQCAGGLVAQEDGGLVGQGAGDADPLLLAAGELGGVGGSAVG